MNLTTQRINLRSPLLSNAAWVSMLGGMIMILTASNPTQAQCPNCSIAEPSKPDVTEQGKSKEKSNRFYSWKQQN